jgi:putative Ca2+/H+ antiporter (TMEM165/GDT1 family)
VDALVPAFIVALLTQAGDRSPWLTAILADRYGKPLTIALAALLAHGLGNGAAAFGATLIGPLLTPNAKALLLALALVFGGVGALWPMRKPARLERWKLGALLTGFLGIFILAAGDTTQFFTFAFGARSANPWLAGVGATLGAFVVNAAAAFSGELSWRKLPVRAIRICGGLLFLATGVVIGAQALRLI